MKYYFSERKEKKIFLEGEKPNVEKLSFENRLWSLSGRLFIGINLK